MGDILLRAVVFGGRVAVAIVVVRVDEAANLADFVGLGLSVFGGGVVLIVFGGGIIVVHGGIDEAAQGCGGNVAVVGVGGVGVGVDAGMSLSNVSIGQEDVGHLCSLLSSSVKELHLQGVNL